MFEPRQATGSDDGDVCVRPFSHLDQLRTRSAVFESRRDGQSRLANRVGQFFESRARELTQFDLCIRRHHENRVGHDRKGLDDMGEHEFRVMTMSELTGVGQRKTRGLGKIDGTENDPDGLALPIAHLKSPLYSELGI